jgi:hypothetical protein
MSECQLLFPIAKSDPSADDLVRLLAGRGWLTARQISILAADHLAVEWDDRHIRALAEAAGPALISGQRGYKRADQAAPDEIDHFANWMESQARKMTERAEAVRRHNVHVSSH